MGVSELAQRDRDHRSRGRGWGGSRRPLHAFKTGYCQDLGASFTPHVSIEDACWAFYSCDVASSLGVQLPGPCGVCAAALLHGCSSLPPVGTHPTTF